MPNILVLKLFMFRIIVISSCIAILGCLENSLKEDIRYASNNEREKRNKFESIEQKTDYQKDSQKNTNENSKTDKFNKRISRLEADICQPGKSEEEVGNNENASSTIKTRPPIEESQKQCNLKIFYANEEPEQIIYLFNTISNTLFVKYCSIGGTCSSQWIYVYDKKGNLREKRQLKGINKAIVYRENYYYDCLGNQVMITVDRNADDIVDSRTVIVYNELGHRMAKEYDDGNDGHIEWRVTYKYDRKGRLSVKEEDNNLDGSIDQSITYTYNEEGKMITEIEDVYADDIVDSIYNYTYDEKGNKLASEYSKSLDEKPRLQRKYKYNKKGELIQEDVFIDRLRIKYFYSKRGNLLKREEDFLADGNVEARIIYGNNCWKNLPEFTHDRIGLKAE